MADINLMGAKKVQGSTVKPVQMTPPPPTHGTVNIIRVTENGTEKGIRVEQIENGYLLTETVYNNGNYQERKVYSQTKPDINVQVK